MFKCFLGESTCDHIQKGPGTRGQLGTRGQGKEARGKGTRAKEAKRKKSGERGQGKGIGQGKGAKGARGL